jgi:hypothetical protein
MFKIMKCYYKYCPYGREVEKEKAIKINNKYYHKDCRENQLQWKQFIDIYDKYIKPKTQEGYQMIAKGLKQIIEKEPDVTYLVYVLCQVIRQDKPLNAIFGLHYYLNQFRNNYKILKLSKQPKIDVSKIETENSTKTEYKKQENKLWGDILQK